MRVIRSHPLRVVRDKHWYVQQAAADVERLRAHIAVTPVEHEVERAMLTKDFERALAHYELLTFERSMLA